MARILIIEDNAENLNLMSYLLSKSGYEILSAMDGEEGLRLCYQEKPDLIICDIQIPKIDGLEVIRRLKIEPNPLKNIPLIAITAYAMVGDREKFLASGCDGYMSKPIQPEEFVAQIEFYLPQNKIKTNLKNVHLDARVEHIEKNEDIVYKGTILIVDDNPADLYLSEMLMRSIKLQPLMAKTISEAVDIMGQVKPNIILSDYHLAEQSALDFLDILKANPEHKNIPFILISSSISKEQRYILLRANEIEEVISRPIEPEKFLACVEKVWNKAKI